MKFEILNRWSGKVQFTAEIECEDGLPSRFKVGFALKWAYETKAVLRGADLSGADLRGAVLCGADLSGAVLSGAVLRTFKADLWMTLTQNRDEVPGILQALCAGMVDGSTYSGECACLVGTIAKVRGVAVETLDRGVTRPAEQWFAMIRQGDRPGDKSGGGFASKLAVEWVQEWCALNGVAVSDKVAENV
jgi:hypothetical protein